METGSALINKEERVKMVEKEFDWDGLARDIRRDILRILTKAGSGHTGGSLSIVEILIALYFKKMRHRPDNPDWPDRDRFILSKGHGAPALYSVLARQGYFRLSELDSLRCLCGRLQGHPYCCNTPGVEISTGSLGQGLSVANGIAMAGKLDQRLYRVYALLGDGELQEGQVWEAAMTSAHYRLDNLCALIDYNKLQIDGPVCKIMGIEPVGEKWKAFGWAVRQIDGHSLDEIMDALDWAEREKGRPSMIICNTVKGKGVSFMENKVDYHGVAPTPRELELALAELSGGGDA
ncbi:transketolase [bacterium]|nr:transketolase [bacterium]